LVFDPSTGEVTGVSTAKIAGGQGKWVHAVVCNGKIYGIPSQADMILVFDPATNEVSGHAIDHLAQGNSKWESATVIDGKIYAAPYDAENILIFDPAKMESVGVSTRRLCREEDKWSLSASIGNKLVGLPYHSSQILLYEPQQPRQPRQPWRQAPSDKTKDPLVETSLQPVDSAGVETSPQPVDSAGALANQPAGMVATLPESNTEQWQQDDGTHSQFSDDIHGWRSLFQKGSRWRKCWS